MSAPIVMFLAWSYLALSAMQLCAYNADRLLDKPRRDPRISMFGAVVAATVCAVAGNEAFSIAGAL